MASFASPSATCNTHCKSKSNCYDNYLNYCEINKIPVMRFMLRNKSQVSLIVQMDPELISTLDSKYKFEDDILSEWNCRVCKNRLHRLRTFIDIDGEPVFCNLSHDDRSELQKSINKKCYSLINAYNQLDFKWKFVIVKKDTLYTPYEGVDKNTGEKYQHYSYKTNFISDNLSESDEKLLQKALNKYSNLLNALLLKVGPINDILHSCQELNGLLIKSVYGKTQVPAVEWFIKILKKVMPINNEWKNIHFTTQLKIIAETICTSPYCEGDSDSAHIGFFHTINGFILDILENGKSPEAVIKIIEERNDPHFYRRKTAAPSQGNIQAAEKLCENLVNTIETIEQLEKHPGCIKIKANIVNNGSMSSAFAQMRNDNQSNKYGSFSKRINCYKNSTASTLSEIIADINSGIITNIDIETNTHSTVYTANTTLAQDDLSVKCGHLWAFVNDNRFKAIESVSHIYHFKINRFNNIMFILKNSRATLTHRPIQHNCMFPEFLAPKHRACEKAVEKLNSLTSVKIPQYQEISLGIGTSAGYTDGLLVKPIKLHITSNNGNHKHSVLVSYI